MPTHGITPAFHSGADHLYRQSPSGQLRVDPVTHLCTDDIHRQESAGTRPVVLKLARATDMMSIPAIVQVNPWTNQCAPLFSHTPCWVRRGMRVLLGAVENIHPDSSQASHKCHGALLPRSREPYHAAFPRFWRSCTSIFPRTRA